MLSGRSIAYRILGLAATVVTFGCVYLFIVAPVLDTTNRAIDKAGEFAPALEQATDVSPEAERAIRAAQRLQEQQSRASAASLEQSGRLIDCMREASGDVEAVQRCTRRFTPQP